MTIPLFLRTIKCVGIGSTRISRTKSEYNSCSQNDQHLLIIVNLALTKYMYI